MFAWVMSGEVVVTVVVADSVVEQEDEVVVPLVGSGVGLGDEQEAVGSVLKGRVLEVAVSEVSVQEAFA